MVQRVCGWTGSLGQRVCRRTGSLGGIRLVSVQTIGVREVGSRVRLKVLPTEYTVTPLTVVLDQIFLL